MKIRMRGNSLRLRLQRQEMKRLVTDGIVSEVVSFGPRHFTYSVKLDSNLQAVTASLEPYGIHVIIPYDIGLRWHGSAELGLYGEMSAPHDAQASTLKILVEKDLHCLKPRNSPLWEDESDAFPNPNTTCGGNSP